MFFIFLSLSPQFQTIVEHLYGSDPVRGFGNTKMNISLMPWRRCQFHKWEVRLYQETASNKYGHGDMYQMLQGHRGETDGPVLKHQG